MIYKGEVALIISSFGLKTSLLCEDMFAVVFMTSVITPSLMKIFFKGSNKVH